MNGLKLNSPKLQNVSEFKWKLLKVPELCSFLLQLQKISTLMEHLSFVCFYNSELFDLYFASSLKKKYWKANNRKGIASHHPCQGQ